MKAGLLWYDDDPGRDLAEKIGRAARRYRQKFGAPANVCYVHPSALNGNMGKVNEVHVAPLPSVLQHHFWVGREEERRGRRTAKSSQG